jgi:hypothetical protein
MSSVSSHGSRRSSSNLGAVANKPPSRSSQTPPVSRRTAKRLISAEDEAIRLALLEEAKERAVARRRAKACATYTYYTLKILGIATAALTAGANVWMLLKLHDFDCKLLAFFFSYWRNTYCCTLMRRFLMFYDVMHVLSHSARAACTAVLDCVLLGGAAGRAGHTCSTRQL